MYCSMLTSKHAPVQFFWGWVVAAAPNFMSESLREGRIQWCVQHFGFTVQVKPLVTSNRFGLSQTSNWFGLYDILQIRCHPPASVS